VRIRKTVERTTQDLLQSGFTLPDFLPLSSSGECGEGRVCHRVGTDLHQSPFLQGNYFFNRKGKMGRTDR